MTIGKTPILILAFARPEKLETLLSSIQVHEPSRKLYLAVDRASDSHSGNIRLLNSRVIELAEQFINHESVTVLIRNINLGTSKQLLTSLFEVFSLEDSVIVLEDDLIPSEQFFNYCDWGLSEFETDSEVIAVQGANHFRYPLRNLTSHYLRYNLVHVWGWATWKDKWTDLAEAELQLRAFSSEGLTEILRKHLPFRAYQKAWRKNLKTDYPVSWDLLFQFWIWSRELCVIAPGINLVVNNGFDSVAVNSRTIPDHYQNRLRGDLQLPLRRVRLPSWALVWAELVGFRLFAAHRTFRILVRHILPKRTLHSKEKLL